MELTTEDSGATWAMQLVLRVERDQPPTASAACATVAAAVAHLLADERSTGAGEWAGPVLRWRATPRKVVRRARGVAWHRVLLLDGLTVERAGASVRVLPPGPVDALPPEVTRLQVGGTDLEDPDRRRDLHLEDGWPGLLVAVTPRVPMTAGKAAAQSGHAAELALDLMGAARAATWAAAGFPVDVRFPGAAGWASLQARAPVEVCDAGHTEVPPAPAPSSPPGAEPAHEKHRRPLRGRVAGVRTWLLLLVVCVGCRGSADPLPTTTTTLLPTTTAPAPTTTTTAGFAVPAVIDLPYVQRVLETIYHLDGEATRYLYARKLPDAQFNERLEAIFGGQALTEAKRVLGENTAEGFAVFADPPGDAIVRAVDIVQATPRCMIIRADLDYGPQYKEPRPRQPQAIIQLAPAEVLPFNPTGWGIVGAGTPLPDQDLAKCA